MSPDKMRCRTNDFALRIVRLHRALANSEEGRMIGKQMLRSGALVAANYGTTCRARSEVEFVAKLGVAVEEADVELRAVLSASRKTAKSSITKS